MDRNWPQGKRDRCIFARFPILSRSHRSATLCPGTDYANRVGVAPCCFLATRRPSSCRSSPETPLPCAPPLRAKLRCPPRSIERAGCRSRTSHSPTSDDRISSATSVPSVRRRSGQPALAAVRSASAQLGLHEGLAKDPPRRRGNWHAGCIPLCRGPKAGRPDTSDSEGG